MSGGESERGMILPSSEQALLVEKPLSHSAKDLLLPLVDPKVLSYEKDRLLGVLYRRVAFLLSGIGQGGSSVAYNDAETLELFLDGQGKNLAESDRDLYIRLVTLSELIRSQFVEEELHPEADRGE